ncbi:NACHT, LRR and PYD domains-containing protein 7, partial [Saguinus oedipus]
MRVKILEVTHLPELSKMAKVELLEERQVEDTDNPELGVSEEVLELAKPGEK